MIASLQIGRLQVAMIVVGVFAHIALSSSFLYLFGAWARPASLGAMLALEMVGILLAIRESRRNLLAVAAIVLAIFAVQAAAFMVISGYPLETNSLFTYVPMLAFLIFASTTVEVQKMLRIIFILSLVYLVIYILLSFFHVPGEVDPDMKALRVITDEERGDRLLLAGTYAVYAFFYSFARLRDRDRKWLWRLFFGIAVLSLYLALSRTLLALVGLVTLLSMAGINKNLIGRICWGAFLIALVAMLYGVVDSSWNPFSLFMADSSGSARFQEYETVRRYIQQFPLTGIGLGGVGQTADFLHDPYVFWTDLGPFGIWFVLGVAGLSILIWQVYICCFPALPVAAMLPEDVVALQLTGIVVGAYSMIAAGWPQADGAIIGLLISLRYWRVRQPAQSPQPARLRWARSGARVQVDRRIHPQP